MTKVNSIATGGYLKVHDTNDRFIEWWNNLTDKDKDIIKSIPNFDSDKFFEITGIRVEEVPTVTNHYDCNHDCDALHEAYDRGFSKGYLEGGADAYCKNDSNALCTAYNNGYSKGFSEGREEEKKEVMLLTDHCIGKCDILENVLNMEGVKDD